MIKDRLDTLRKHNDLPYIIIAVLGYFLWNSYVANDKLEENLEIQTRTNHLYIQETEKWKQKQEKINTTLQQKGVWHEATF